MRNAFALLMLVLACATPIDQERSAPRKKPSASVFAWLCNRLGVRLDVYSRVQGVRGPASTAVGRLVASVDLATGIERIVAECGTCWSPMPVEGVGTLFVKNDGVWLATSDDGPTSLLLPLKQVTAILGLDHESPRQVLVAVGVEKTCEIHALDLRAGTTEVIEVSDSPCDEVITVRAWARFGGRQIVSETDPPSMDLQIRPAFSSQSESNAGNAPLRIAHPLPDVQIRMDPVWARDAVLVYLAR